MNNRRSFLALVLLGLTLPSANAAESHIAITDAWARATPPGKSMSSAYLSITNRGTRADVLLDASSPMAAGIRIHRSVVEGGMSRMRPAEELTIAPGATLNIEPTGLHLMLVGLTAPLLEGRTVPLTLRFRTAGSLTVQADIRPLGATSAHRGH